MRKSYIGDSSAVSNECIYTLLENLSRGLPIDSSFDLSKFPSNIGANFDKTKKSFCSIATVIMSTQLYERINTSHDPTLYINILKPLFRVKCGKLRNQYLTDICNFIEINFSEMKHRVETLTEQILCLAVYIGKDEFNRILQYIKFGQGGIACNSGWSVQLGHIISKEMRIFFSDFLTNCTEFKRKTSLAFGESCESIMQIKPIFLDPMDVSYLILCINGESTSCRGGPQIKSVALQILFFKLSQVLLRSTGENRDDSYRRIYKNLLQPFFHIDIIQFLITGDEDFLRLDDRSPKELTDAIFNLGKNINRGRFDVNYFFKIFDDINSCKEIEDPEGKLDISNITNFVQCFVTRHERRFEREHGSNVVLSN